MNELILKLKQELNAKPAPGEVLNNIADQTLTEFANKYEHNENALWIGAYIADLFITEAKDTGDITQHVPMALEYAQKVIIEQGISKEDAEIILEIIATHHGGEQKHIESKLFKNADCFKFLYPKGVFHIFSAFYNETEESFEKAIQYTMFKVEEKFNLVDLDEETIAKAKDLYTMWQPVFKIMGYDKTIPDLYKK